MGNQMFQYAAARQLAILNDAQVVLDVSAFLTYKLHRFSLQHFACGAPEAAAWEIRRLVKPTAMRTRLERLMVWRRPVINPFPADVQIIREKGFEFDQELLQQRGSIYLDGYWQSPDYFSAIADRIRDDFQITTPPSPANQEMAHQITSINSISLHVRRGDYTSNAKTQSIHGTCSKSYYDSAIQFVCQKVPSPRFFIFSDEIEWARQNLNTPGESVFVDLNDAAHNYEDLRLMSLCKHHIIANSTFSWWGAWLGDSAGITVAPSRWMSDTAKGPDANCILPAHWVQLSPGGEA
jgi:hypothetical protein